MRAKNCLAVVVLCAVPMFGAFAQTAEHQAKFIQLDHGVYTFEYRNTVITAKCINTTLIGGTTLEGCSLAPFMPGDSISTEMTPTGGTVFFEQTDTVDVVTYWFQTVTLTYDQMRLVKFKVLSMKPKGKKGVPALSGR